MEFTVRDANLDDLKKIHELFAGTIKNICNKDYTPDQVRIWVDLAKNTKRWTDSIRDQYFLVAINEENIIGFGSLDKGTHIDFMFTHKDFQNTGVASTLLEILEKKAQLLNSSHLTSDVSKTARTFFEKHGFFVVTPQSKVIDGVEISNFRMEKKLPL